MKITRIYTGDDNRSHLEDIEVPLHDHDLGRLSEIVGAEGLIFRETGEDYFLDYHNAPRKQFVANLTGVVEVETGDGSRKRLGPGTIIYAEDTTGQGHISRGIEGPRNSLFILVPDDYDVTTLGR